MHEQSETVQLPTGEWVNVYGKGTPQAGQRLPGTPSYRSVQEAVEAAKARSQSSGKIQEMLLQRLINSKKIPSTSPLPPIPPIGGVRG